MITVNGSVERLPIARLTRVLWIDHASGNPRKSGLVGWGSLVTLASFSAAPSPSLIVGPGDAEPCVCN